MADKTYTDAITTYDDNDIGSGMLSSPHIAYCIKKYNIFKNTDMSCLGPATYHMRIGGKVMTWRNGKKVEYLLGEEEDKNKNIRTKVELEPNSLTFVTTIEEFNLPKDIIARFNLKSKWVHEGLLLGTGPIVDPELKAHLLIPLHNFSSQVVTLNYNDKLISVELTKTLNPADTFSFEDEDLKYIKNKSRIFNFEEYRKRIGGKQVESSVSSKFEEFNKTFEKIKKRLSYFTWGGAFASLAVLVGLVTLVFTSWMLITDARDQLTEATNIIKVIKEDNIDYSAFALVSDYSNLQSYVAGIKKYNEVLSVKNRGMEEKMNDLERKIKKLERKIESRQ